MDSDAKNTGKATCDWKVYYTL